MRAFVSKTTPAILDAMNALPVPYRWVCRWIPFDKQKAVGELTRLRKQWFAKRKSALVLIRETLLKEETLLEDPDAVSKTEDRNQALEGLEAEIDRLLFRVMELGGLEEVEQGLRRVRRLVSRAIF